jgi:hypothetical protein
MPDRPRRVVPNVLAVSAFQFSDPLKIFVQMIQRSSGASPRAVAGASYLLPGWVVKAATRWMARLDERSVNLRV